MTSFAIWLALTARAQTIDLPSDQVSVKTRWTTPYLPDGVDREVTCVVRVVIDPKGKPIRVEPGDCPEPLAAQANVLLAWTWWAPEAREPFTEARFKFRLLFSPIARFPPPAEPGWALNQAFATHRYRPDGADHCVVTGTLHVDGDWTDLTTNHETSCRIWNSRDVVAPGSRLLRAVGEGVTCTARFEVQEGGGFSLSPPTGCPPEAAEEIERLVPRWIWTGEGEIELRVTLAK